MGGRGCPPSTEAPCSQSCDEPEGGIGPFSTPYDVAKLATLSRGELCACVTEFFELSQLITPLKTENVRLSKCLLRASQLVQEVAQALRSFFRDPTRREWIKEQGDDIQLMCFFQRLIEWYKQACDDDNPTLAFYRRIWRYERGVEEPFAKPREAKARGERDSVTSDSAAAEVRRRTQTENSSVLYDACLARAENILLSGENERLREENAALRRSLEALQRTAQAGEPAAAHADGTDAAATEAAVAEVGVGALLASSQQFPAEPRPEPRTLAQLAASDHRWALLLHDSDRLFSGDDVVDEAFQEYLGEIVEIMEQHGCTFKRGIELVEDARLGPTSAVLGEDCTGSGT
eukprot:CAMPEP_0180467440 /NCGR_PEP_ID=MMETSP1036_2-20121128/27001_1 /TAXON_ID=632150 /ORGANISM="Azadinium spinosum, Strain 3D9" /LENGTH=347 /DNA_ID=CAMNT_0022474403 /DNA_START=1 /DNA_END=1041 /DNA_ORIENTATION=+